MGMNFPNTPSVGQQWPSPPISGQPVYRWDGTVWGSLGAQPGKMPVYTDGSTAMTAQLTVVNPPVNPTDAAAKGYVDTNDALKLNIAGNQTTTGGFRITAYNATQAGGFTCNAMNGNYQYYTNSGAMTITAPANDCAIDYLQTNAASGAGAVTFSGFTVASGNTGDALTTAANAKFIISVRRINGTSTYVIKALQ
jgi:hypothetical protein